jgi:hypothetical protein
MARRRALARALAGLGEGMANASATYLRHNQQKELQDRYDKRAEEAAKASFQRTEFSANRAAAREIQNKIATGELDPQQGAAMITELIGENVSPQSFEPMRPSLTKRLGKKFDPLMDAQFPEGLPTDEEIATFAGDATENGRMSSPGAEFLIDQPMNGGALAAFKPEVRDFANAVGVRRRALQGRPTERVKITDPITGAETEQAMSPYDMRGGITVSPTAEQEGALEGTKRATFLENAGGAEAEQAGAVAGATEDARNTPGRQRARTREAVDREIQVIKGTMPYKLELASKSAAQEIQQAVNKENATNVAGSIKASGLLMGPQFFDQVVEITRKLNTQEGVDARLQGLGTTIAYYTGGAPELKELEQLISQNRRLLGQAFGVKEGNPSDKDMENVRSAIGLDQWSTATERINALRHLQDMISIGPTVSARLPATAGMAERMELAKRFTTARRQAEDAAVAAGATEYNDPVTNSRIKVIR